MTVLFIIWHQASPSPTKQDEGVLTGPLSIPINLEDINRQDGSLTTVKSKNKKSSMMSPFHIQTVGLYLLCGCSCCTSLLYGWERVNVFKIGQFVVVSFKFLKCSKLFWEFSLFKPIVIDLGFRCKPIWKSTMKLFDYLLVYFMNVNEIIRKQIYTLNTFIFFNKRSHLIVGSVLQWLL